MRSPRVAKALLVSVALTALVTVACGGSAKRAPSTWSAPSGGPPAVGDPAPEFTLQAADGSEITLDDVTTARPALFYFSMGPG